MQNEITFNFTSTSDIRKEKVLKMKTLVTKVEIHDDLANTKFSGLELINEGTTTFSYDFDDSTPNQFHDILINYKMGDTLVLKRSPSQEISSVRVTIYGIPALRWKSYGENLSLKILSMPVMTSDGDIYSLISRSNQTLKINKKGHQELTNLNLDGTWYPGVVDANDKIYCEPHVDTRKANDAACILHYDPKQNSYEKYAKGGPFFYENKLLGYRPYFGSVLANNGYIYLLPFDRGNVAKFNPIDKTLVDLEINYGGSRFMGGVLANDGHIYLIPAYWHSVVKINTETDMASDIGPRFNGAWKWQTGVLAKDGNIYCCPREANKVLKIDVQNQTAEKVGPTLEGAMKWCQFVEDSEGFLIGIPSLSNHILRFDPTTHEAILMPLEKKYTNVVGKKWIGGIRGKNGIIYAIPFDCEQVLQIGPVDSTNFIEN